MASIEYMKRSFSKALSFVLLLVLSHSSFCQAKTTAKKRPLYERHKNMCRGLPSITKKHERDLQQYFKTIGETKIAGKTPQNEAACWMFRQGKSASNRQRYALAVVYYASKGAQWDINTNWMTPKHECSWYGVTCNAFRKIVELDLGYIELEGELRFVDFGCPLVLKRLGTCFHVSVFASRYL